MNFKGTYVQIVQKVDLKERHLVKFVTVNPLSPKSDQHQISPHKINTSLREKVIRINKMITKGKLL